MGLAGSDDVLLDAEAGVAERVGSEGWCRGESGEGVRGGGSEGPGLVGNATLEVSDGARASGLGTRSGRFCAYGMLSEEVEGARTRGGWAEGPRLVTLCWPGGGVALAARERKPP